MIRNRMQNHNGSKPAPIASGVNNGTKISTIDIQSRKNLAMNRISIIRDSSIQGVRLSLLMIMLAVLMPPPPMNTPVNSVPASSTVMIMAVILSVLIKATDRTIGSSGFCVGRFPKVI